MLQKVRSVIEQFNMISEGDTVVVGLSGGADSVTLFINLCEYRKYVDFNLVAVHINHLIRDEAGQDARFAAELCKQYGVEYRLFEIDVQKIAKEKHLSSEEAGRILRYEAMRSLNPDKIAVGHHKDDQAETVLLNICRGTGIHGLAGIAYVSEDIIRPLLDVSRQEIEEYLSQKKQNYCIDSTNLTTDYTRNKIRNKVIPYLTKEVNENVVTHISSIARDMDDIEAYFERVVRDAFNEICFFDIENEAIELDKNGFEKLDDFIKRELILNCFDKLTPKHKDITRKHILAVLSLKDSKGEKRIDLPYGLQARSIYEKIIIGKKRNDTSSFERIEIEKSELVNGIELEINKDKLVKATVFSRKGDEVMADNKYTKLLDYDKIKCSLELRNRKKGDYLVISNDGRKKSLKDYMINEKIPREERDDMILLADGSHIMWILGHRISAEYKITELTKNILKVEILDR